MTNNLCESKPPCILVVDDDPTVRLITRASLEQSGFVVKEAIDGEQALEIFPSVLPDAVLLDVLMPGLNGFATCAAIRRLPMGEDIPILVITGLEDIASIKKAYEMGATDFLTKPINWIILQQRIVYMLRANKAFKDLRQSERRLAHAQSIAKVGYWEWNFIAQTCFCSREACQLLDIPLERCTGGFDQFEQCLHPDCREAVREYFARSLPAGKTTGIDAKMMAADGSERYFYLQGEVIRDAQGSPVRASGSIQDITERKKTENELQKVDKLESLRVLAGGIAHDFNNILMSILGNVSLSLLHKNGDEETVNFLLNAEKAALRARDLAQQLLAFSTAGSPIKSLSSLSKIIEESVRFASVGSPVSCEFSFDPKLWPAEVDQGQISQVFQNLVINAIQAMPSGGKIKVLAQNRVVRQADNLPLKPGQYLQITVMDNGLGIQKENLDKIFDPFFSTKDKGSGLGLATSYAIIKNHGGHILVDSRVNEGAQFELFLPATHKTDEIKSDYYRPPTFGKGRVLLMDDEIEVREVVQRILKYLGYEVDSAGNGEEAVRIFQESLRSGLSYDLAILDLTVPGGMGGKDTMKRLLALDPKTKGIVISGYAEDSIMINYQDYGFCNFIRKPFRVGTLSRILEQTLKSH